MGVPFVLANLPDGLAPLKMLDDNWAYLDMRINGSQSAIHLTTNGNTGPATLVGGNLNIPNYGAASSGNVVVVTTAGPFAVGNNDAALILNKVAPSATVVNLPAVAGYATQELVVSDFAGNAGDITINAFAGENIMGLASMTLASGGQGAGLAGSVTLYPVPALSGWYVG